MVRIPRATPTDRAGDCINPGVNREILMGQVPRSKLSIIPDVIVLFLGHSTLCRGYSLPPGGIRVNIESKMSQK